MSRGWGDCCGGEEDEMAGKVAAAGLVMPATAAKRRSRAAHACPMKSPLPISSPTWRRIAYAVVTWK